MVTPARQGLAEWLVATCGVWQVGLGLYFIFFRPALLPEDIRYLGADVQALQAAAPHLFDWLGKVFAVMGGFMVGAGLLLAYFGWEVMMTRPRWATLVLALFGAVTFALMSAVNFVLSSDFRWVLLAPVALWVTALARYALQRQGGEKS